VRVLCVRGASVDSLFLPDAISLTFVDIRTVKGETQPAAREEVRKAFEFALEHMGMDISSTQIWQDFLTFLKAEKATNPFEEGTKMTAIRKLFQRAVENPMHNLEAIWKDYDQFENGLNKTLAKELLSQHQPKYMGARVVYRERKSLMEGILRNMLARPPRGMSSSLTSPHAHNMLTNHLGTIKEEHQVRLWRRLLVFEKTNPQKLDAAGLRARVTFTYNQCLLCLYHYPDMWLEFANYQVCFLGFSFSIIFFTLFILCLLNKRQL
jgi:cleavage stimulation factor subunit 3